MPEEQTFMQIRRLQLTLPKWVEQYRWSDDELRFLARQDARPLADTGKTLATGKEIRK